MKLTISKIANKFGVGVALFVLKEYELAEYTEIAVGLSIELVECSASGKLQYMELLKGHLDEEKTQAISRILASNENKTFNIK